MENMEITQTDQSAEYGVIVARFQVDQLHEGHKYLIDTVNERHDKTVIVLGLSHAKCTKNNPLDKESRKQMILEEYPNIIVKYIEDCQTNEEWSTKLDKLLDIGLPSQNPSICLYGSRDSFVPFYTTRKYPVVEIKQKGFMSGTKMRKDIVKRCKDRNLSFRKGCIFATMNQYPACVPCIDIAIFNNDKTEILLGRKNNEKLFRFIGGFVDPGETFEHASIREAHEEAGKDLELTQPVPMHSFVINDWRYRGESNKITSFLFATEVLWGRPEAGDDIEEVRWFTFNSELVDKVVINHIDMMKYLLMRYK